MTEDQIEQEIQDKGLTASRITPQDIADSISGEYYFTAANGYMQHCLAAMLVGQEESELRPEVPAELGMITFCVLVLKNGHRIVGVNTGPVSEANFNTELARKLAKQNAVDQIWPLLGYALRDRIYQEGKQ